MTKPSVIAIFITAKPGEPMQSVGTVEAVTAKGLKGDRKFRNPSHPKKDTPDGRLR